VRSLAVALTLALLAAACSTSVAQVELAAPQPETAVSVSMDIERPARIAAAAPGGAEQSCALGDEGTGEESPQEDDADPDDVEMIAMLAAGPSLALLHARDVRWGPASLAARLDHTPSDLIRPPIRA
jgi:hypothetical protein